MDHTVAIEELGCEVGHAAESIYEILANTLSTERNGKRVNVVDGLFAIADAIDRLADAMPMHLPGGE